MKRLKEPTALVGLVEDHATGDDSLMGRLCYCFFFWVGGWRGRWLTQNKASSCIFVVSCNLALSVFELNNWSDRIIEKHFRHVSVTPSLHISVSHQSGYWLSSQHAPVTTNKFGFLSVKLHSKAVFARKVLPRGRFPPCAVRCCPERFYSNHCCWPRYLDLGTICICDSVDDDVT